MPFVIREPEGRPLRHVAIWEAEVVGGRNGICLHMFEIWDPEWCPFTFFLTLGLEMVSVYTFLRFAPMHPQVLLN